MGNNEGPVIIDSHFEDVTSQSNETGGTPETNNAGNINAGQYEDGAMAAALREAGLIPPEGENTPQHPTTSEIPTATTTTENQPIPQNPTTPEATTVAQPTTEGTVNNSNVNETPKKTSGRNPHIIDKNIQQNEEEINDIRTPNEQKAEAKKSGTTRRRKSEVKQTETTKEQNPETAQYGISKEDLDYVLINPKIQELMKEILKEKREEDKKNQYVDENGNLVNIPDPIKEEMALTFNKDGVVMNAEDAARYGNQENELYDRRIAERRKELKENGFTDAQIDAYMEIAKHDIKLEIQQYVKGTVTRDFRGRVIDRINSNPEKYKEYIDPTTGKVISSISDENLIGRILSQKVYPKWYQGELDAIKKPEQKEPEPTPKKTRRWGLIGGVLGFTAAVAGGASVGLPITIGATVLTLGAKMAETYAPKKIASLTEKLANAKTPEEKAKLEKRLKVWNFVNKHAHNTMKFFGGMATGAGIGTAISNFFMGGKGLVEVVGNRIEAGQATMGHGIGEGPQSQVGNGTETGATNSGVTSEGPTNFEPGTSSGTETGSIGNNTIPTETNIGIDTNNGILIKSGRVNLPGSAWNGNLGTQPPGGLANGALNPSNFTGGATNMGAFNLESALQTNGVTESLLRNNLQTSEIHRLLNIFTSNPSTDLSTALQSLNSEGAKTILEAISG
ncbi:MAG TPA: hypothetical protein PK804_00465 [Candidatus Dojkabacteria bacterium]|nr:hypothetical protein [Candidatus Dojkabacteria bacterium]